MCGRYFFDIDCEPDLQIAQALEQRYGERAGVMARGEVFPGQMLAVRANDRSRKPGWFLMKWGFQREKGGGLLINARSETAFEKPTFKESMINRRCLLPFQSYYEWTKESGEKYEIWPADHKRCYLAGLYRHEANGPAVAVLTRLAAPDLRDIHHRMPVIFSGEAAAWWLFPGGVRLEEIHLAAVNEMNCRAVNGSNGPG